MENKSKKERYGALKDIFMFMRGIHTVGDKKYIPSMWDRVNELVVDHGITDEEYEKLEEAAKIGSFTKFFNKRKYGIK